MEQLEVNVEKDSYEKIKQSKGFVKLIITIHTTTDGVHGVKDIFLIVPSASILYITDVDNVYHGVLNSELSSEINKKYPHRDRPYIQEI